MMNNLMNLDGVNNSSSPKMQSREIAEITGKQHRNVMRDCDKLNEHYEKLDMLKIQQGSYVHENTGNQQQNHGYLPLIEQDDENI